MCGLVQWRFVLGRDTWHPRLLPEWSTIELVSTVHLPFTTYRLTNSNHHRLYTRSIMMSPIGFWIAVSQIFSILLLTSWIKGIAVLFFCHAMNTSCKYQCRVSTSLCIIGMRSDVDGLHWSWSPVNYSEPMPWRLLASLCRSKGLQLLATFTLLRWLATQVSSECPVFVWPVNQPLRPFKSSPCSLQSKRELAWATQRQWPRLREIQQINCPRVAFVEVFPHHSQWRWWIRGLELSMKAVWWMSNSVMLLKLGFQSGNANSWGHRNTCSRVNIDLRGVPLVVPLVDER